MLSVVSRHLVFIWDDTQAQGVQQRCDSDIKEGLYLKMHVDL